jgi:hypothetical protein
MILSAALYFISAKIIKSYDAAILFNTIFWIIFFMYGSIWNHFVNMGLRHRFLIPITIIFFACCFIILRICLKKVDFKVITIFVCIVSSILLCFNLFSSVKHAIMLSSNPSSGIYKVDFIINDTLPTPNVYWFHCDGMFSFDGMEKYFGDPQYEFVAELENRSFLINREAQIEAGRRTIIAVSVLMSPFFYDNTLSHLLPKNGILPERTPAEVELRMGRAYNELIHAFNTKYNTAIICKGNYYLFPSVTDYFYHTEFSNASYKAQKDRNVSNDDNLFYNKISNLIDLMSRNTMLTIFAPQFNKILTDYTISFYSLEKVPNLINTKEIVMNNKNLQYLELAADSIVDALLLDEPRFLMMTFFAPHCPFIFRENGELIPPDSKEYDHILSYPGHHVYSAKLLINLIDIILERDPNALIVLQGDHGLHGQSEEQIMDGLSIPEENIRDIWNGTISAVRIPDGYPVPDKPLNPLDITRYLVNNFIGENYEYVDEYVFH